MKSIYSVKLSELEDFLLNNNEKKFRATQIIDWLYVKRVNSFSEMTNLSKDLINKLNDNFYFDKLEIIKKQEDKDVSKFLFKLSDNNLIEAVLMNHDYGNSLCVSSQVGCNMGCKFCESGRLKKIRNLETGEMVEQILMIEKEIGKRISHVVVMGIGEPFDNFDNLVGFIEIINLQKGINLGSRHITVSTCGIVPKIYEFSKLPYQVNLAISLHAPINEIRDKIMPINKVYKIEELMKAITDYSKVSNRRVTFEYIMLDGINDSVECAKKLADLIRGMNAYVNLIPYNETENISFKRTEKKKILEFYDILKKEKINVTIRREFGGNIDAACGQLRAKGEVK
jgi:23S rRNA (adenine2503-C2)-methyltransferase